MNAELEELLMKYRVLAIMTVKTRNQCHFKTSGMGHGSRCGLVEDVLEGLNKFCEYWLIPLA